VRGWPALAALGLVLSGCLAGAAPTRTEPLRFVALGDSYTAGTAVDASESWPRQLVSRVPELTLAGNLAVNGYASTEIVVEALPRLAPLMPEFVTLLVGANDIVRRVPEADYQGNVAFIVDALVGSLGAHRVLCLATPDFTVTPQGAALGDPAELRARIMRFNDILGATCAAQGVAYLPAIFDISGAAGSEPSLVASDGLHPSGAQYARWVDAIAPVAAQLAAAR